MRAEKVTAYLLQSSVNVAAVVGEKITAVLGPQADQAPFIVYWKEQAQRQPVIAMDGPIVVEALISVQYVAKDYPTLKVLAEAGRAALIGKFGNIAGVDVNSIQVAAEGPDFYEPDLSIFGQQWQFSVTHEE